ncbi:transposase [Comamonas sp.]|uniref:transposase n=1 Tax=Comamonas sp. TaxID=34028 RepID=UPI00387E2A09
MFLEVVLWVVCTGSPWRDLPPELGKWNALFKRCSGWVNANVFQKLLGAVGDQADMKYFCDGGHTELLAYSVNLSS